jgi:hypothetical protein
MVIELFVRRDRRKAMVPGTRANTRRELIDRALPAGLWVVASAVVLTLAYRRYDSALRGGVGGDFRLYFNAARAVVAGHSPYTVAWYVYPPVIAVLLAPIAHVDVHSVWKLWTGTSCAALFVSSVLVVLSLNRRLSPVQRPVLFAIAGITAFHFWPTTITLWLGQADTFVLVLLAASALATQRGRSRFAGFMLGLAGLAKAWPASAAITVLRREYQRRWLTFAAFGVTIIVAPILAVAMGGITELSQLLRVVFDARTQHLVSDSVWGIPSLNFSHSGLAHPVLVSVPVQAIATIFLLAWVIALAIVSLRSNGSDMVLGFWNVVFCIILVLPISHIWYAIYGLPILWCWIAQAISEWPRPRIAVLVVMAVLVLWWLVFNKAWPDNGSSAAISSLRYSVVFATNLFACTASVLGARGLAHSKHPASTSGGAPSSLLWNGYDG